MYKACGRCGRIHDAKYQCPKKIDFSRYGDLEERKLRNTKAWADKSQEIRSRAQYLCEVCRDKGIYTYDRLEVHHITKLRQDKDGLLDNANLVCLCSLHHKQADRGELDEEYLRALAARRES